MHSTRFDTTREARAVRDHGAYLYVEIGSVLAFFALAITIAARLASSARAMPWTCLAALAAGVLAADFFSGLVHWAGDTWGTEAWPIIGKSLIAPFRVHHVDQEELTLHGFFAINGSNCLVSLPVLAMAFAISAWATRRAALFVALFLLSLCVFVLLTNQFHKWAHERNPPRAARLLQRLRLALPPEVHAVHHRFPHLHHYCITTGWLNGPLDRIDFFRRSERLLTQLTGAEPRAYLRSSPERREPASPRSSHPLRASDTERS